MSEWKKYRKKAVGIIRDYIPGEDLERQNISVSIKDMPPVEGGKICKNPSDENDQWYISPKSFEELYDTNPIDSD